MIVECTDLSYWHENDESLTTVSLHSMLSNEGRVYDMHHAFMGCTELQSVTSYEYSYEMYSHESTYSYMTSRNGVPYEWVETRTTSYVASSTIDYYDASSIVRMDHMFEDCIALETVDLSYFNITNVVDMRGMFHGCTSLTTVVFGRYRPCHILNADGIFDGCTSLAYVCIPYELRNEYRVISEKAGYHTRLYRYIDPTTNMHVDKTCRLYTVSGEIYWDLGTDEIGDETSLLWDDGTNMNW